MLLLDGDQQVRLKGSRGRPVIKKGGNSQILEVKTVIVHVLVVVD